MPKKSFTLFINSSANASGSGNVLNARYDIAPLTNLGLTPEELRGAWNVQYTCIGQSNATVSQSSGPYLLALQFAGAGKLYSTNVGSSVPVVGFMNVITDTSSSRYFNNTLQSNGMLYIENLTNLNSIVLQVYDTTYTLISNLTTTPYVFQFTFTQV